MIPIRDTERSRNYPIMTTAIIAVNVVAFLWQISQGRRLEELFLYYGLVPARYSDPLISSQFTFIEQILPFFTSMFLHGGFLHIIGNMWFLYIFGDNVEDRLGCLRYLLFYISCGICAGLIHLLTNWHSRLPTVGASGAIAGVMGGYLLLYPRAKILTLVPIFFFIQFFEIPAYVFLGYWFLIQILSAGTIPSATGGVAWWAHIGGFVSGMVFLKVLDAVPRTGLSEALRQYTARRTTPRVHTVSPIFLEENLDVEGTVTLTPREARWGARKILSIPYGLRRRTIVVTIPPGVHEGTRLRLRGLGRSDAEGNRGDLLLQVHISG